MAFDRAWSQPVERTPPGGKAHPKRPGIWSGSLAKLSKPLSQGLSKLILEAVATSKKRTGLSLQALKKIIMAMGYDMAKKKTHFKRVLLSLVTKGLLQKLKGTGASGSFGIGKEMAKKMSAGHKKKKAPKKRQRPLKVGIAATKRGRLVVRDLPREPGCWPAAGQSGRENLRTQETPKPGNVLKHKQAENSQAYPAQGTYTRTNQPHKPHPHPCRHNGEH
uniref:H15 domain-containing protein n=1 Tax=Gopherus agassizii TaxID=38772 RepID=A0A452HH02_9SAUR